MEQLRAALAGPHGTATTVTWAIAATVAWTLLVASVTPRLRGDALEVAMFLRKLGFWGMVITAPFAAGQVFELRPPKWLRRTHLGLAAAFLLLLASTDLVLVIRDSFDPLRQFGPLAVAFLIPVAAFAGWWLLACLGQVRTRTGLVLFALGGSITTLALVVAALVVDPVLADHFLVVAYLPVLAAASLLELQRTWSDRPRQRRPERTSTTTSQ